MTSKNIRLPSSGGTNRINSALVAQIISNSPLTGIVEIEIYANPLDAAVLRCHFQCIEAHLARNHMTYRLFEDPNRQIGLMLVQYNKAGD